MRYDARKPGEKGGGGEGGYICEGNELVCKVVLIVSSECVIVYLRDEGAYGGMRAPGPSLSPLFIFMREVFHAGRVCWCCENYI